MYAVGIPIEVTKVFEIIGLLKWAIAHQKGSANATMDMSARWTPNSADCCGLGIP